MRKMAVVILISVFGTGSFVPFSSAIGNARSVQSGIPAPLVDDYEVIIETADWPLGDTAAYGACAGQVAGSGRTFGWPLPDETHALYWPQGSSTGIDLHPFEFGESAAMDTSGHQQVGVAYGPPTGYAHHAWLWNGAAEGSVDLHPAGIWNDSIARATAGSQQVGNINYIGQGEDPSTTLIIHAALWNGSPESVLDLHPPLTDCDRSYGEDTDGVHQVGYGYFGTPDSLSPYRALLWEGSAASAVDLHPPAFTHSFAEGVWGDEQVGYAFNTVEGDGYTRALLWQGSAESVTSLHPDGLLASTAYATNGTQQVGFGETAGLPSTAHALRWSGTKDSAFDLHSLLPEEFSEGNSIAYDIDAEGNIAGAAQRADGSTVAILWRALVPPTPTPTPTPSPTPTPTPLPGTPVVSAVAPTSGPAVGGTNVTVSGTNFESGALVTFGSIPANDIVSGGSSLMSASSPPLSAGNLYDVEVVNPNGAQRKDRGGLVRRLRGRSRVEPLSRRRRGPVPLGRVGGLRRGELLPGGRGDPRADGRVHPERTPRRLLLAASRDRRPIRGRASERLRGGLDRATAGRRNHRRMRRRQLLSGRGRDARTDGGVPAEGPSRNRLRPSCLHGNLRRRSLWPARPPSPSTGSRSSRRKGSRRVAARARTARTTPRCAAAWRRFWSGRLAFNNRSITVSLHIVPSARVSEASNRRPSAGVVYCRGDDAGRTPSVAFCCGSSFGGRLASGGRLGLQTP